MKIAAADYAQALYQLVKENPQQSKEIVGHFIKLIRKSNNRHLLGLTIKQLEKIEATDQGKIIIEVTAAEPLTDSQRDALTKQLNLGQDDKQIEFKLTVKPDIIGGLRLKRDDEVIDATVDTKLTELYRRLVQPS